MRDLGVYLGHSSPRSRAVDDEGTEQGLTRLSSGFKPRRLPEAERTVSTGAHRPRAPDFPARQFRAQRRLHAGCSPVSVHSDLSTSPLSPAMAVSGLLRVHVALVSHCPTDPVFLCPPCLLQDMSRDDAVSLCKLSRVSCPSLTRFASGPGHSLVPHGALPLRLQPLHQHLHLRRQRTRSSTRSLTTSPA